MNILHLSDFHINDNNKDNFPSLCQSINVAIKSKGIEYYPHMLLLTGDFTETGNQDEYRWFENGLDGLLALDAFKKVKHVMLVPGNHDFSWSVKETRQENFLALCKKKESGITKLDNINQKKLDSHLIKHVFATDKGKNILIIGLNTMKIDSKDWPGIGYFTIEQIRTVNELITNYRNKYGNLQIFVAFHHHLVPIAVLERDTLKDPKKFTLTLDARRAINNFLNSGVEFALHGHQHQPSMVTWKDNEHNGEKELHIISAGCLAGKLYAGENARNSFMLYSIHSNKVVVSKAESSERDFDEFAWYSVDFYDKKEKIDNENIEEGNNKIEERVHKINRKRILSLAEQDDRWINRADQIGAFTIKGLVGKLVDSIADDGSVAYEIGTKSRYRTSTLATVLECMYDIGLLPEEDLKTMQWKLMQLKDHFEPLDEFDDVITKTAEDKAAWGIDEAPSVWTTSKALTALFKTKYVPSSQEDIISICESVVWLANQAYDGGGWGYQKCNYLSSCAANVPMTALAMIALSYSLTQEYICNSNIVDNEKIKNVLEAGIDYLKTTKKEIKQICYWTYGNKANLSASIWALEAWQLASEVVHENKKIFYSNVYKKIEGKVLGYVISKLPEQEGDDNWTECFFKVKKEIGLKYKPQLRYDKAFYSFTPYLISYFIKSDVAYTNNDKIISVIKWVLAHRDDSWLIEHNYNSQNACTISVAMAINVIVNWLKAKANVLIEQECEKLFLDEDADTETEVSSKTEIVTEI